MPCRYLEESRTVSCSAALGPDGAVGANHIHPMDPDPQAHLGRPSPQAQLSELSS